MKTRLTKKAAAMMAACIGLFAACEDPNIKVEEPNFPVLEDASVEPGESVRLDIEPNMAWIVSVPAETIDWFWIAGEAGEKLQTVKGTEGVTTIEIMASDAKDFEIRTCAVTMTMGGQTSKIITITKNATEKTLTILAAKTDESGFVTDEDNNIVYDSENPVTDLSMFMDNTAFICQQIIKVTANFNFALKDYPEWVEPNANSGYGTSATVGENGLAEIAINLRGNVAKLPLEDASGKLVFVDTDTEETVKEIGLSIAGVGDYVDMDAFEAEFNAAGHLKNSMTGDYTDMPKFAWFKAPVGSAVYAIAYVGDRYRTVGASDGWVSTEDASQIWVTFEVTDESTGEDAENTLHDYKVNIRPLENSAEPRTAQILVLPKALENPDNDLFAESGDLKQEYSDYIKGSLVQEGGQGGETGEETLWPTADEASLAAQGVKFEKADASDPMNTWINWISSEFGVPSVAIYQMTMNKAATVSFASAKEIWGAAVYCDNPDTGSLEEDKILAVEPMGEMISISCEAEYHEGFIILQTGEENVNFAIIKVVYDINADISGGALISFAYPEMVNGATLVKMDETDPLFEVMNGNYWGINGEIYVLTYTQEQPQNAMLTYSSATGCFVEDGYGDWLSLSDEDYLYVTMKPTTAEYGTIVFNDNSMGWPMPKFVLVCKYAVSE